MKAFDDAGAAPDRRLEEIAKRNEQDKERMREEQARRRPEDMQKALEQVAIKRVQLAFTPPTLPQRRWSRESLEAQARRMVDTANEAELAQRDAAMKREIAELRAIGRPPEAERRARESTPRSEGKEGERSSARAAFERGVRGDSELDRGR